jgi:hypothetical protein
MDNGTMIAGVSNIMFGVLMIALSIPLARNKIGMNRWYGMRFSKSFESSENWYKINRYGAGRMIRWSIFIIVIGIAAFFLPLHGRGTFQIAIACVPLLIMIPVIESWLYAKRLKSDG